MKTLAIYKDEYNTLFQNLGFGNSIKTAVGVSGGADSMALALLEADRNPESLFFICDHGLREESGVEAELVAHRLQQNNIKSHIIKLKLSGGSAIQERARQARYEAMLIEMYRCGFTPDNGVLLIGHHQGDQAETVSLRLEKKSGTKGLSGMLAVRPMERFFIARPFLSIPKSRLVATLVEKNQEWVEDPSNQNTKYTRVKIRQSLKENLDLAQQLIRSSVSATESRKNLQDLAEEKLENCILNRGLGGSFKIDLHLLGTDSVSIEALRMLIQGIAPLPTAGSGKFIDTDSLNLLINNGKGSLGGVLVSQVNGSVVWVSREPSLMQQPIQNKLWGSWDGRYRIIEDYSEEKITLGSLGADSAHFRKKSFVPTMPVRILQSTPAWRSGDQVISLPELKWGVEMPLLLSQHPQFSWRNTVEKRLSKNLEKTSSLYDREIKDTSFKFK